MYVAKLPAKVVSGERKGQQAFATISNQALAGETDGKKNPPIVFEIEQDRFEYPQFGPEIPTNEKGEPTRALTDDEAQTGIQEFVNACGSVQRALEVINEATEKAAVNTGKAHIRTAPSGSMEQIVEAGLAKSRNFSWVAEKKVKVADIKNAIDEIKTVGLENLSEAELRARLAALIGG